MIYYKVEDKKFDSLNEVLHFYANGEAWVKLYEYEEKYDNYGNLRGTYGGVADYFHVINGRVVIDG